MEDVMKNKYRQKRILIFHQKFMLINKPTTPLILCQKLKM